MEKIKKLFDEENIPYVMEDRCGKVKPSALTTTKKIYNVSINIETWGNAMLVFGLNPFDEIFSSTDEDKVVEFLKKFINKLRELEKKSRANYENI